MKNQLLILVVIVSLYSCSIPEKHIYFSNDGVSYSINPKTEIRNIRNDGKKPVYATIAVYEKRKKVDWKRQLFFETDSVIYKDILIKPNENISCNYIVSIYEGYDACGHILKYDFQYVGSFENGVFYKTNSYTP